MEYVGGAWQVKLFATVDFTAYASLSFTHFSHFSFENATRLLESADMYTIFTKTKKIVCTE